MLKKDRYKMTSNLKNMFLTYIRNEMKKEGFGNARTVRNFVDKIKIEQASRLAENPNDDVDCIKKIDLENAIKNNQTEKTKRRIGFCEMEI